LVVDEESSVLRLCRALLEQAGFAVLEADGSSEALKVCTHHDGPLDLLITALTLPPPSFQIASSSNQFPHVHGYDLAVRAATIQPGLRVILMSDNPDKELASYGITRTVYPILTKPFDQKGLVNFVREVLRQPAPALTPINQGKAANDAEWFG
jgi:DNA-binding response OmpR family regulator